MKKQKSPPTAVLRLSHREKARYFANKKIHYCFCHIPHQKKYTPYWVSGGNGAQKLAYSSDLKPVNKRRVPREFLPGALQCRHQAH